MTGFMPLLKKEILEQLRTYRLLIVGGVFLVFGISTPFMLKYLPQILELTGSSGLDINIPPPTAAQSLAEYAGTIGQIGVLVAVLVTMGSIANELKHGTAVITLSKPVSRAAFVNAKMVAASLTFLVSMVIASVLCFVYTVLYISQADILPFVGQNLLLGLFLIFCLAVTLLFSSMFKSSIAAGGISLGVIIAQGGLSALPGLGDYFPGKLLGWGNQLLISGPDTYWWALFITVLVIIISLYLSQRFLRNKEF